MLGGMDEHIEYDTLFWTLYGHTSIPRRVRRLRALRSQTALDLADAELHVTALRHRLLVLDNVIRDYMLGGKQGVR